MIAISYCLNGIEIHALFGIFILQLLLSHMNYLKKAHCFLLVLHIHFINKTKEAEKQNLKISKLCIHITIA